MDAKIQNSKVHYANGELVVMRSIEKGPNPQVPVNQAIPNFPSTPKHISEMNGTFPLSNVSFFSMLAKLIIILRSAPMLQGPHIPGHASSSSS